MSVVMRFGHVQSGQLVRIEARVRAAVRRCIAEEVERLVDMLDVLDGDADMEDEPDREDGGDAEPSLGWENPLGERMDAFRNAPYLPPSGSLYDDRELDEAEGRLEDAGDEREMDDDTEHSLGWTDFRATEGAFEEDPGPQRFFRVDGEFEEPKPVG